jgi:transcriptional regulator with PAS, ATPase and Fis domain
LDEFLIMHEKPLIKMIELELKRSPVLREFVHIIQEKMPLNVLEQHIIEIRLKLYKDNRTQCAKSLGISVRTLQRKLKKYARL